MPTSEVQHVPSEMPHCPTAGCRLEVIDGTTLPRPFSREDWSPIELFDKRRGHFLKLSGNAIGANLGTRQLPGPGFSVEP